MATAHFYEERGFHYPADCKSKVLKDKHKMQTMCENPEILFVDFVQRKNKEWQKNNLLFFSDSIHIWKEVLCSNYAHVISEGIGSGGRLTICKDEHLDKDNPILTIHYYTNGKVLIQSSEAHLNSFEEGFPLLKAEVHSKKISVLSGEEVKVLFENPNTLSICAPPTPTNSATQLKHSIALLELDFAEFREQIQTRLSDRTDNTSLQQLSEELQQLRTENQSLASELRGNLEEIRQENIALRTQMVKVKEDAVKRERSLTRQVQHLTEKLSCTPKMSSTETQTLPLWYLMGVQGRLGKAFIHILKNMYKRTGFSSLFFTITDYNFSLTTKSETNLHAMPIIFI